MTIDNIRKLIQFPSLDLNINLKQKVTIFTKYRKFYSSLVSQDSNSEGLRGKDPLAERVKTLGSVISSQITYINGLASRNGGRGLIGLFLEYIRAIRSRASKSLVKQVCVFSFFVAKLVRHSGLKGAVLYLKACQVLLQQVVGGYRVVDLSELKVRPRRNKAGLPLVIPAGVRVRISRDRNIADIKLGMTLFGLFRILDFKGKLSLSTITDPGVNLDKFMPAWDNFCESVFVPLLSSQVRFPKIGKPEVYPILKSSPTTSFEVGSVSTSSIDIKGSAGLGEKVPYRPFLSTIAFQLGASGFVERLRLLALAFSRNSTFEPTHLGKLGFKLEPAGKVRVFAMVDAWTQGLLRPLHVGLFDVLRQIPDVDGTFNQVRPIYRLQHMYADFAKGRTFSSIDLSAATDRLPIDLQFSVIRHLLRGVVPDSDAFAESGAAVLVDRKYKISLSNEISKGCEIPSTLPKDVMYTVGQPMGALSSGGMLAMTHHAIIQFAAYRAGFSYWFDRYAILGDDVVIAHGGVAYQYRLILQEIGVKAGLAKSIIARSRFVVEFAKSFFVDDSTANMLPLKECVATRSSTALAVEFIRKYEVKFNAFLAFMGYGYRARAKAYTNELFQLGTRMRVLVVGISHPSSGLGFTRGSEGLFMKSYNRLHSPDEQTILRVLRIIDDLADKKAKRIDGAVSEYFKSLDDLTEMLDKESPLYLPSDYSVDPSIKEKLPGSFFLDPGSTYRLLESFIKDKPIPGFGRFIGERGFWSFYEGVKIHYFSDEADDLNKDVEPRLVLEKDLGDYYIDFSRKLKSSSRQYVSGDPRLVFKPETKEVFVTSLSFHEYMNVIDDRLEGLFNYDPLTSIIPSTFWKQDRSPELKYKDFLKIYAVGQEISRPVWASYYVGKSRNVALGPNDGVGCLSVTLYTRPIMSLIKFVSVVDPLLTPEVILIYPNYISHYLDRIRHIVIGYENMFSQNKFAQPLSEVLLFTLLLCVIGTTEVGGYESPGYLSQLPELDVAGSPPSEISNFGWWLMSVSLVVISSSLLGIYRYMDNQIMILEDEVILQSTEVMIRSTRIIEANSQIADLISVIELSQILLSG